MIFGNARSNLTAVVSQVEIFRRDLLFMYGVIASRSDQECTGKLIFGNGLST